MSALDKIRQAFPDLKDSSDSELLGEISKLTGNPYEDVATTLGVAPRGTMAETARQAGAGFAVDLPRMVGKGLQYTGVAPEAGRSLVAGAEERAPGWTPDLRGRGLVGEALVTGARAIGPMAPAIAASFVPGGQFVAPAVAAGLFGTSSAQETYEKLVSQGVPEQDAIAAARRVGLIQGPLEGAATAAGLGAFRAAKPLVGLGGTTAGVAARMTDAAVLKPFAKGMAINLAVQPSTEVAQDVGTQMVERAYGAAPEDIGAIARSSALGGLGLTMLLGPLAIGGHVARSNRAEKLKEALYSPDTTPEIRAQAIDLVMGEARRQNIPEANVDQWFEQQLAVEDARNVELAKLEADQQGDERDLLFTEEAPIQQRIDQKLGLTRKTDRKGYEKQFEAAFAEGTGQRVADATTGVEREVTAGELAQRDLPQDLTVAATEKAKPAVPAIFSELDTELLKQGVKPTKNSRDLYQYMVSEGIDPVSPEAEGVLNALANSKLGEARKAVAEIIRARSPRGAGISTIQQPAGGLGVGGPVVQGGVGDAGRVAPTAGAAVGSTPVVGAPLREASVLPVSAGELPAPVAPITPGAPLATQAPQAIQAAPQGQEQTTRGAAGTTALIDTSDDALEIARATGNAGEIEAMREDEAGMRADQRDFTEDDLNAVIETQLAKGKNRDRDRKILRAYIASRRMQAAGEKGDVEQEIADTFNLDKSRVRQIGNPQKLANVAVSMGFDRAQVFDLLGIESAEKSVATELGKLEGELGRLESKAKPTAADISRMSQLDEKITRVKNEVESGDMAAAFKAAGIEGEAGEAFGNMDDAREWQKASTAGSQMAVKLVAIADTIDGLRTAAAELQQLGLTKAAAAATERINVLAAEYEALAADIKPKAEPKKQVAPVAQLDADTKAATDQAKAKWQAANRDLTKLEVPDLTLLRNNASRLKNAELANKITAEINSRGGTPDAVQVESPAGVSVQPKAEAGQRVGGQVRSAEKPAAESQVQAPAKILTQAEQAAQAWDVVAADFPEAPKFADLTKAQQQNFIGFGSDNWTKADVETELTRMAKPAAPAKEVAEQPEVETTTDAQRKNAEVHADELGGTVVWQEGPLALVQAYSVLTGQPVYALVVGNARTSVDVEAFTGTAITAAQKTKLVTAKKQLESAAEQKHATDPFIKFNADGVATSAGVPAPLAGVIAGWKQMLGLKVNLYVTTIEDAKADKNKFTGPHRAVGSSTLNTNEAGSARRMPNGDYYVAFTKGTSVSKMLELLSHEMGHVHEKETFAKADRPTRDAITAEHRKWLAAQKGVKAKQLVEALRAKNTARGTKVSDTMSADELSGYWTSFSEWYADQVSRWAVSSEKPLTVVDKFFAKLAATLRKFYYSLKGAKYLPSETMKQFLDKVAEGQVILPDAATGAKDFTSSQMFVGVNSLRGLSKERAANSKANLAQAKILDAAGQSATETWFDTGWYKGSDGKWRNEILDDPAKLKRKLGTLKDGQDYFLSEVLSHPELEERYSALATVTVVVDSTMPRNSAVYDESTERITVASQQDNELNTLLHEVQHAVQALEGFAQGGNLDSIPIDNVRGVRNLADRLTELAKSVDEYKFVAVLKAYANRIEAGASVADALTSTGLNEQTLRNALYRNITGEIEAFDVEARKNLDLNDLMAAVPAGLVSPQSQFVRNKTSGVYAKTGPSQGLIDRNIAKLPKMSQQPVKNLTAALGDLGGKGLDYLVFTSDLVKRAVAVGLPAAQTFSDRLASRNAKASEEERKIEKIADKYASIEDEFKGSGPGSVNEFLFESTRLGKWGYGKYRDDGMGSAFDALGPKAQQFVKDVFAYGDTALSNKKTIVLNAANSEYDAMIKDAQVAGDTQTEAKLKAEKVATLKRFQTLFRIREGKPYAPIKRTGAYVVIGESAAYQEAKANKDTATIKKLESDPDNYHVSFVDTKWEARNLRDKLAEQGVFSDAQIVKRSESFDEAFSGEAMLPALTKMRAAVDRRAQDATGKKDPSAGKLLNIINQLYLEALAEGSARKSEMRRRGVAGEVDMLKSFTQQGRADANFLASVEFEPKIQDALQQMRNQSRTGDRERKSEIFDELTQRYAGTLDPQTSPFIRGLTNLASKFFLATSPGYYLQNLTQPFMMSLPAMAGRHDYTKAASELAKAYTELGPMFKDVKLFDEQFDFSKVPADVRAAINDLVNQGKIDIGLATEINEYKVDADSNLGQFASRLNKGMRLAVQKTEAVNRLSTAIAAYRLEFAKTKDAAKATQYAANILSDTHGDYTAFNAPRAFNTSWGKVALQFRKFQLIQIAFYAKLFRDIGRTPEERAAAMKTLAYSLAHTAVFAGMMGLPGYAAISAILGFFGDDDEPYDLTAAMRKELGPEWADMIMRGAPTVVGMDLSGKIGAGNMLSIMPFSNADLNTNAGRAEAFGTLMGGAALGMSSRVIDGLGLIVKGDYYKGVERTMPKGVSDALKAGRQGAEGLTRRNGDVILPDSEVSALDTVLTALGVPVAKQAVTYERQNRMRDITKNFSDRTTRIKNDYVKAVRNKDTEGMAEARASWTKLQQARQRNGLKPQPISNLLKSPQEQRGREKRTIGGVSYRQGQQRLAESVVEN